MTSDEGLDVEDLPRDALHFRRRVVELAADQELHIELGFWRDAIVFVETGEIELECAARERRRFSKGAVLCLLPPVRVLRNCGACSARLIAISRRRRSG